MLIESVSKFCPAFILGSRMVPPGFSGITLGPLILIHPDSMDDESLRVHELKHAEQFYRSGPMFWIKYIWSKKYRLEVEAEAFAAQAMFFEQGYTRKSKVNEYAFNLSRKYKLEINFSQALEAIQRYM